MLEYVWQSMTTAIFSRGMLVRGHAEFKNKHTIIKDHHVVYFQPEEDNIILLVKFMIINILLLIELKKGYLLELHMFKLAVTPMSVIPGYISLIYWVFCLNMFPPSLVWVAGARPMGFVLPSPLSTAGIWCRYTPDIYTQMSRDGDPPYTLFKREQYSLRQNEVLCASFSLLWLWAHNSWDFNTLSSYLYSMYICIYNLRPDAILAIHSHKQYVI